MILHIQRWKKTMHTQTHTQVRAGDLDDSLPVTLSTLQDDLLLSVVLVAQRARCQAGTGGTLSVIILPITPQTRRRGTTLGTGHTPMGGQRGTMALITHCTGFTDFSRCNNFSRE